MSVHQLWAHHIVTVTLLIIDILMKANVIYIMAAAISKTYVLINDNNQGRPPFYWHQTRPFFAIKSGIVASQRESKPNTVLMRDQLEIAIVL